MEAFVCDDSPLAAYLEGHGHGDADAQQSDRHDEPPATPSPNSFAPRGVPKPRSKIRQNIPPPLRLDIPSNTAVGVIHNKCSEALNSTLGRAENERFLEQFRYMIIASQLLSSYTFGPNGVARFPNTEISSPDSPRTSAVTLDGAVITAVSAFSIVWLISWARGKEGSRLVKSRILVVLCVVASVCVIMYAYMRRQWLQYLRQQTINHTSTFLLRSQDLDAVASGALSLVQEVELVSRGYRICTPLPPITRLEDRNQTRRCARLRKALQACFSNAIPRYLEACAVLKPLVKPMDLDRYYDIYDISSLDLSEANLGFSDPEFDDPESLRVLKIISSRFYIIRKVFLCCLLAMDAHGGRPDFLRWSAALEEIQALDTLTSTVERHLRSILDEEQSFPVPPTPKMPLTPNRERWRAQMRKLNSLSSGIRGLQAKLHVVRDETDNTLHDTGDVSGFGVNLMMQFESIGVDLKALMQEWEDAKAALAMSIDKREKRMSSMSGLLSPTTSLGGRTAVDDGPATECKEATDQASRSSHDFSSSDAEEIFEAIALPKSRSTLTREERIEKMKDDRLKRVSMKERVDANTHMLRELQTVIKLRPRGKTTPANRVTSLL